MCVQGITQVLLRQVGALRITNEEREGPGYVVAGNGMCMTPKYKRDGKQQEGYRGQNLVISLYC